MIEKEVEVFNEYKDNQGQNTAKTVSSLTCTLLAIYF